jgi:hypothetical protein
MRGNDAVTTARAPGPGKGSGRSSSGSTTLKTVIEAPIAAAIVRTMARVVPGQGRWSRKIRRSRRTVECDMV